MPSWSVAAKLPKSKAEPTKEAADTAKQAQRGHHDASLSMKKFSKLFQRLGTRGRTDHGLDWDVNSTRETSPDVHQLTSRRGAGEIKRPPRNGLSRISADELHPPCDNCAAIDFDRLLNWQPGQPRPWIALSHTLAENSECPYCIFFQAMVGAHPDETRKFTPYLRIRQAFERLGISDKQELGKAVLFEVTTKSKLLPWGYIVKATQGDNDMAGYSATKPVLQSRIVSPKLDPALPKLWMNFCKENHLATCCRSLGPPIRGLKLIDCDVNDVVQVEDIGTEEIQYVTLSYAWEKTERAEDHMGGLPEMLPQLIADTINMTRALGFRYLWVDRYCCPTSDVAERRRKLDLMGDIFSGSALTLIVTGGEGVSQAMPGVSIEREQQLALQTESGLFATSLIRPDVEIAKSEWASRGWTYQEGLFSKRRLVFTPSQIYFQCQSLHCHESIAYPLGTTPALNLGQAFSTKGVGSRPGDLRTQINDYIQRDFSVLDDRLDAFRGVLDRYTKMEPAVESFLGLPLYHSKEFKGVTTLISRTDRLMVGLGWRPDVPSDDRHYAHPVHLQSGFPSWTWLAWKARRDHGSFAFNFLSMREETPLIDTVTAVANLEASMGFKDGSVLSWESEADAIAEGLDQLAFLRLKTYCFDLEARKVEEGTASMTDPALGRVYRANLVSTIRRAMTGTPEVDPPPGEYSLVGVLIASQASKATHSANVLICGRRNWEADGKLTRLDAVELNFEVFEKAVENDKNKGMLKGVITGPRETPVDVYVEMREVDIY